MPDPLTTVARIVTIITPILDVALERLVPELRDGQNQSISDADLQNLPLAMAITEQILDKVDYEQLLKCPALIRCLKDGIYQAEDKVDEMSICGRPVQFQVSKPLPLDSITDVQKILDSTNIKLSANFGGLSRLGSVSLLPSSSNSDDRKKHLRRLWPSFFRLQKCFLLASIFPKSYKFEKDDLIQLWMAQGFIRDDMVANEKFEDIGSNYLCELEQRNIFSNSGDCYQLRDELHELAKFVSLGECLKINVGEATTNFLSCITVSLRHFSLLCKSSTELANHDTVDKDLAICVDRIKANCEGLRTFLLHIEGNGGIHEFCFKRLASLKLLRVLDISCSSITEVTDSISCLKNLRYLNLSKSKIKKLPRTIRKLERLWILKLNGCKGLRDLPSLGELVNLGHLLLDKKHPLDSLPPGIGRLIRLETFSCPFVVGIGYGEKIGELKNMNNLRGSLCISKLENVLSSEEASEAALHKKQYLQKLKFEWTENEECDFQVVLAKLKPHKNLEILKLSGYGGKNFPDWVSNPSFLPNLTKVSLSNCIRCEALPAFWRLQSLKSLSLSISGTTDLAKTLNIDFGDIGFISLEILQLKNMPDMTCWVVEQAGAVGWCPFPKLSQLIFKDCPELVDLKVLHKHGDDVWLPFPKLNQLTFQDCPNLRDLEFLQRLNSDCRLKIKECPLTGWMGQHPNWQTEMQEDGSFIYSHGGWLENRSRELLGRWWK